MALSTVYSKIDVYSIRQHVRAACASNEKDSLLPRPHPSTREKGLGTHEQILGFVPSACSVFW